MILKRKCDLINVHQSDSHPTFSDYTLLLTGFVNYFPN